MAISQDGNRSLLDALIETPNAFNMRLTMQGIGAEIARVCTIEPLKGFDTSKRYHEAIELKPTHTPPLSDLSPMI